GLGGRSSAGGLVLGRGLRGASLRWFGGLGGSSVARRGRAGPLALRPGLSLRRKSQKQRAQHARGAEGARPTRRSEGAESETKTVSHLSSFFANPRARRGDPSYRPRGACHGSRERDAVPVMERAAGR